MIGKLLFRFARTGLLDAIVRFGFAHASGLLPVRRICQTREVIAFRHPRPAWPRHVLFVPKVPIPSLQAIRSDQVPLVRRVIRLALHVASRLGYKRAGFVLLVNGGAYQDVGQLHVHLATWPREAQYEYPDPPPPLSVPLLGTDVLTAYRHPRPGRVTHIVMLPPCSASAEASPGFNDAFVDAAIVATQRLVASLNLQPDGYTLIICVPSDPARLRPCFHLVAGARVT